jgi:hypothetical protein
MKSREERLAEYIRISALLPQAREELMRYPGVRDVAVGVKETKNLVTEEIGFRVYVDEKKALGQLPRGAVIPKQVLGVGTDVVVEAMPENFEDSDKYRPLIGGIQIGNDSSSALGTLGCIAQRNGDHSIVALSNSHVMRFGVPSGAPPGEKIGQPSISCCCCCKSNIVGEVVNSAFNGLVDCAIARITGAPGFTNEILDIGLVFGSAPLNGGGSTVGPNDRVWKRGITTGLTTGTVVAPLKNTLANPAKGIPARTNQIEIKDDPGTPPFARGGDSGSVIVNAENVVVGLLWGGIASTGVTHANLITDVISALDITILNSGTAGTIPLGSPPSAEALAEMDAAVPLDAVVKALEQSEAGRTVLTLFKAHRDEINELVNTNRHVKVSWHRYQGPAYTAHVIRSGKEPSHRIPTEIEGVSPANLLIRMSVVLQEHGTPALAAAVEKNTLPLLNLLAGAASVRELIERVGAVKAEPVATTGTAPAEGGLTRR